MELQYPQNENKLSHVLEVFQQITEKGGEDSLSESLKAIAETAAVMTGGTCAGIFIYDSENNELKMVASYGVEPESDPEIFLIPRKEAGWIDMGKSQFMSRITISEKMKGPPAPFRENSYWSPMKMKGTLYGYIAVVGAGDISHKPAIRQFMRLLCAYATTLIDKGKLYSSLKRHYEEMKSLYDVVTTITGTLDLDRVLKMIVESVGRLCKASACSIMLIDEKDNTLRINASIGIPPEIVKTASRRLGEGISGKVALTGEPFYTKDITRARDMSACNPSRYKSPSMICVPLKARGRVIGVLNVNDKQGGPFTPEDFNLVTLFANQAAIAIDNARLHRQVYLSSITDGLTQTHVRSYFKEKLDQMMELAKTKGITLAVIMADLDHFKKINDEYGHTAGDVVLKGVAEILRKGVRSSDLVARYGGEEFIIVLPGIPPLVAIAVCERIRSIVESTIFKEGDKEIRVTISLGLAMFPYDADTPNSLIEFADEMMYKSKNEGRNRVSFSKSLKKKIEKIE